MVNTFFQLLRNRKVGPSTENLDINCFPPHGLDKRRIVGVVHFKCVLSLSTTLSLFREISVGFT